MNSSKMSGLHTFLYSISVSMLLLAVSMLCFSCKNNETEVLGATLNTYNCGNDGGTLQLDCPALPNTNLTAQPDFDIFAWNSFAALNWPALIDENNLQRGIADLSKSFVNAKHDDVLVWETYKEKREVFNVPQDSSIALPPWNSAPVYDTEGLRPGTSVSYVPGSSAGSGGTAPDGIIWNALDETIEVKSESLETDPASAPAYGQVVSPRVWRGPPSDENPVLYEVKVNYDFYKYVDENKFYVDAITAAAANDTTSHPNPGIRLPWRTSATDIPSMDAENTARKKKSFLAAGGAAADFNPNNQNTNVNRVVGYSSSDALTQIENANNNPSTSNLPPLEGAVHIKAAWIQLQPGDDTSSYHTTVAEYYKTGASGIEKQYATFGLVGLHIIQRVHLEAAGDTTAQQEGGTFIFATWEHLQDTTGFTYSNYRGNEGQDNNMGWYPHEESPADTFGGFTPHYTFLNPKGLDVKRKYPILPNTVKVNQQVWAALGENSVWRNYQLVGTQFQAVNSLAEADSLMASYNDPLGIGQPQYLANLVIETNEGLQHFQGQPPNTITVKNFNKNGVVSNGSAAFMRDNKNLSFGGEAYNMGGCMGCHGVAQSEGYSFSFVLLGGYDGATTDTDSLFDLPPPSLPKE